MRKRIVPIEAGQSGAEPREVEGAWLDLERLATVEVSSEDPAHPVEAALLPNRATPSVGWRAAQPGPQLVRLRFDAPQRLRRIWLRFEEATEARTQELVLRWSGDGGASFREIVRQQWTFSPDGATREEEDYAVELDGVDVLELAVVPHVGGGESRASLVALRLA